MSAVIQDPAKLREFCRDLAAADAFWAEMLKDLEGDLGHLSQSWKDENFTALRNEFFAVLTQFQKFSEDTKKTIVELERDANALDQIQKVRR